MKELNNRVFKIWSYTVSHNSLILRSPQKFTDMEDYSVSMSYNIDIEFSDVNYINIPTDLYDLTIEEIKKNSDVPTNLLHFKTELKLKIFKILSLGEEYYIVAQSYIIGKNTWISEDRISNINLQHDEVLKTSE